MGKVDEGQARSEAIPNYQKMLDAFHAAFRRELQQIIDALPLPPSATVLDVGCGDGFYSELLAARARHVVGIDANQALLARARAVRRASNLEFRVGEFEELGDSDEQFDFVWCAQSLYSFTDNVKALKRMVRVLRPGGQLALLENDTLHQFLLPWPPEIELALRNAEWQGFRDEESHPRRFYVGRRLPQLLKQAGLSQVVFRTQAIDRAAPLDPALQDFLTEYLAQLGSRALPHIDSRQREALQCLLDDTSAQYLARDPDFVCTWINVIALGTLG